MERVEKIELNVPSIFAHGVFIRNGTDVLLTKKGIEYYYSLIYLVRNKLVNAFERTKNEDGKILYNIDGDKWNREIEISL